MDTTTKRRPGRPPGTHPVPKYTEVIPPFTAPPGSRIKLDTAAHSAGLSRAAYMRQVLGLEQCSPNCKDGTCGASDCEVCHPDF